MSGEPWAAEDSAKPENSRVLVLAQPHLCDVEEKYIRWALHEEGMDMAGVLIPMRMSEFKLVVASTKSTTLDPAWSIDPDRLLSHKQVNVFGYTFVIICRHKLQKPITLKEIQDAFQKQAPHLMDEKGMQVFRERCEQRCVQKIKSGEWLYTAQVVYVEGAATFDNLRGHICKSLCTLLVPQGATCHEASAEVYEQTIEWMRRNKQPYMTPDSVWRPDDAVSGDAMVFVELRRISGVYYTVVSGVYATDCSPFVQGLSLQHLKKAVGRYYPFKFSREKISTWECSTVNMKLSNQPRLIQCMGRALVTVYRYRIYKFMTMAADLVRRCGMGSLLNFCALRYAGCT
jgi:hypothetical protein